MRTIYCGELRKTHAGQTVTVCGWVSRVRNLGGLLFVDLRDREGIVQLSFPSGSTAAETAQQLSREDVVKATGMVSLRPQPNAKIPTGEIELTVTELTILSEAATPPYELDEKNVSEDLRLKYRYYDLRRPELARNLRIRAKTAAVVRKFYDELGFVEVETPVLMRSTPEGARDYIVPSRVHHGTFYALPQSPQQYKQLLMVSGLDRYYQIVKCFRDEDLRADRQPEFTQVDVEMSFVEQEHVMNTGEEMLRRVLREVAEYELPAVPRMTYAEAMKKYGSDKPDIRFGLEIQTVTELFANCGFGGFDNVIASGGCIAGIKLPNAAGVSRKVLDGWQEAAKKLGLAGLVTLKKTAEGLTFSIGKFVTPEITEKVAQHFQIAEGEMICFAAAPSEKLYPAFGNLRLQWARELNGIPANSWAALWVTGFPLLEWDEEGQRFSAMHHPFTSPADPDAFVKIVNSGDLSGLGKINAKAYDLVLNGNEIGGGSIRNHRNDVQTAMFRALSMTEAEAKEKFGFFLEALTYGTPPHGGIAFGFDRMVALLCGIDNIRDVIAFPKTTTASSLMDGCPASVSDAQLKELGIRVV
ncbi:MAG: aspartate--tRNA ligase [bacterium]|nr:aspartate--tRNA ligase [bacterium]